MRYAQNDEYQTGSLQGGLPTCVFAPKPFTRIISNIVVGNTTTSEVACYRGILGSTPVAQNLLGANNTLKGDIRIPSGQTFFVQWSAVGASVRDAFARVSWVREDDPFVAGGEVGQEWATNSITSLQIPNSAGPNDPSIVIGADLPVCMQGVYTAAIFWRPPGMISDDATAYFIAQRTTPGGGVGWQQVDIGFLVDNGTSCEFFIYQRRESDFNAGILSLLETIGQVANSGPGVFSAPTISYQGVSLVVDAASTMFIQSPIDWDGCTTVRAERIGSYNSGSTSYADPGGADSCGVAFTVPPGGKCMIFYNAFMSNDTAGNASFTTIEIREGNIVGSGSIVTGYGASDDLAIEVVNTAGNPDRQGCSELFNSGTPGDSYNVRLMNRVTGGTGTFARRSVIVQPTL